MSQSFESEIQLQLARWAQDQGSDAAWDARRLVNNLSKANQHNLAVEHGNRALEFWDNFEPLSSTLSWALYRKDLADLTEESDLERLRHAKQSLDCIKC